jgi:tetratricopeptide (TPR) repeat protein
MPSVFLAFLFVFASALVAAESRAENPFENPLESGSDKTAEASALYQRGAKAYRAGKYREALAFFQAADLIAPRAALSFNVARAYDRLGERDRAVAAYREYLKRDTRAPNASWVRARIAALEPDRYGLSYAQTSGTPPKAPPRRAKRPAVRATTVPREPPEPPRRVRERSFSPWSWLIVGTGSASLAAAGALEMSRRREEADARAASDQRQYAEHLETAQKRQATARLALGVGAGLVVTGGTLLVIDLGRSSPEVRAATRCTATGCLGELGARF